MSWAALKSGSSEQLRLLNWGGNRERIQLKLLLWRYSNRIWLSIQVMVLSNYDIMRLLCMLQRWRKHVQKRNSIGRKYSSRPATALTPAVKDFLWEDECRLHAWRHWPSARKHEAIWGTEPWISIKRGLSSTPAAPIQHPPNHLTAKMTNASKIKVYGWSVSQKMDSVSWNLHLCSESLMTGVFPDEIKMASVVHINKNGDRQMGSNDGPVTLQFFLNTPETFSNKTWQSAGNYELLGDQLCM